MSKDVLLIVASVAALVAISAATFLCSRRRSSPSQRGDALVGHGAGLGRRGLDEAVLLAYPTLVFSSLAPPPHHHGGEEGLQDGNNEEKAAGATTTPAGDTAARCAVCQADYAHGDELQLLPECLHAFHRPCIDQWLRRRPTCPVCRASPPPHPQRAASLISYDLE
jgi:hypothetical protein